MAKSRTYRCCACISPCTMIIESPGLLDVPDRCCIPPYEDEKCKWERVVPPHQCQAMKDREIMGLMYSPTLKHIIYFGIPIDYCPFCGEKLEGEE